MKTRILLAASLALLFLIGGLAWLTSRGPSTEAIKVENCKLLHEGMTRSEVIKIIGAAPGDYRSDSRICSLHGGARPWANSSDHWICDSGELYVEFDTQGRVTGWVLDPVVDMRPNWLRWVQRHR